MPSAGSWIVNGVATVVSWHPYQMLVSQAAALLNHEDGLELQQMPVSTSGIWFQASWRSGQFHCKCLGAHRAGEPDEAAVA